MTSNIVLFYAIWQKLKLMFEKILLIMLCWFSNDLFSLKKCRILQIEYLTSNKEISGIKLLTFILLISQIYPAFLKYEIKEMGSVM